MATSILDSALFFYHRGFSIIPIPYRSKKSFLPWREFQLRRPTESEIIHWFKDQVELNLAIICGEISQIVVADADSIEAENWARLNLPYTPWMVRTGSGFTHRFYRHPGGHIGNRARIRVPGGQIKLDIKADGGYVIGAGSVHPNGQPYVLAGDWNATLEQIPVLDMSLIDNCEPVQPVEAPAPRLVLSENHGSAIDRARAYLNAIPPAVQGQAGDNQTFKAACKIARGFALTVEEAMPLLLDWNSRCVPPWSVKEIYDKLQNAAKYGDEPVGGMLDKPSAAMQSIMADPPPEAYGEKVNNVDVPSQPMKPECDFKLWDASQSPDWPEEPLEWVVDQLIPKGGIGFVSAPPKDRKSLLMLDLSIHLAQDQAVLDERLWLDKYVCTPQKVLYISREDPRRRVKERMDEICKGYPLQLPGPNRLQFLIRDRIALTQPEHVAWLKQQIVDQGFTVIVLDVLNRMIPDLDEMSSKDMARMVSIIEEINRDTGVTILCLDHTRKPQNVKGSTRDDQTPNPFDLKGSMAKYGAADFMLCMARTPDHNRFQLYVENKDTDERPLFFVDVSPKGSGKPKFTFGGLMNDLGKNQSQQADIRRNAIRHVFVPGEGLTRKQIEEKVYPLKRSTVINHLNNLISSNVVVRSGKGKETTYSLNPNHQSYSIWTNDDNWMETND